jgi:hypothetical protein
MGLWRYMVNAAVLEGPKPSALAKAHGISQSWICAPAPTATAANPNHNIGLTA